MLIGMMLQIEIITTIGTMISMRAIIDFEKEESFGSI